MDRAQLSDGIRTYKLWEHLTLVLFTFPQCANLILFRKQLLGIRPTKVLNWKEVCFRFQWLALMPLCTMHYITHIITNHVLCTRMLSGMQAADDVNCKHLHLKSIVICSMTGRNWFCAPCRSTAGTGLILIMISTSCYNL